MNILNNILKGLFGSGKSGRGNTYDIYVKPKMCEEILRVSINMNNDLSRTDDYSGFWVRKTASATRCPFQAEITLYFDGNRNLKDREIENGEFVDEAAYEAFIAGQNAPVES